MPIAKYIPYPSALVDFGVLRGATFNQRIVFYLNSDLDVDDITTSVWLFTIFTDNKKKQVKFIGSESDCITIEAPNVLFIILEPETTSTLTENNYYYELSRRKATGVVEIWPTGKIITS